MVHKGRGRRGLDALVVHEIQLVPYELCDRSSGHVTWPPSLIEPLLTKASTTGMAVLKLHSHPSGYEEFSETDDRSDRHLFESVFGWVDGDAPHVSAIMLPDGSMIGRTVHSDGSFQTIPKIAVIGSGAARRGAPRTKEPRVVALLGLVC